LAVELTKYIFVFYFLSRFMKAEIITIGDELLIGQTVDTNSAYMGSELSKLGFTVERRTSVGDTEDSIISALHESTGRADVILVTGGLGPTSDDITKPAICKFFNTHLVRSFTVLATIQEMLERRGFQLNDNNIRQADLPESCTVLPNHAGTAAGMMFEKEGSVFIFMPGVPGEMVHLMTEQVVPFLRSRYNEQSVVHRTLMTYGSFEAKLAETLRDFEAGLPDQVKLAYLPTYGVIKLRLTAKGRSREELNRILDFQTGKLHSIIGDIIFSDCEESMEMIIAQKLLAKKRSLSVAESCTGGKVSSSLTSIPGCSEWFKGSIIAYDNSVKTNLLSVPASLIDQKGAVSREVAEAMAEGVRMIAGTDFGLATSGIAGPTGGSDAKPVGTLCIAVSSAKGTYSDMLTFGKDRIANINRFSVAALNMLRIHIDKE
jgi:nicotinamide-nucleotide amidase